jgi:hypothetical protein
VTADEVIAFLRQRFPDRYCAACLALKLGASLVETREYLGQLLERSAVLLRTGECDSCTRSIEVFSRRVD